MFNGVVSSGGAVSLTMQNESIAKKEPFKAMVKATMALACSVTMFMPTLSSAAVTKRAQEAVFYDYATALEVEAGTRLEFISESAAVTEEAATGLDLLFPNARSSNTYEQKIVADLIDDFFV